MGLSKKLWFRIVVDLLHDITGGAWVGGAFVLWMVRRGAGTTLAADALDSLVRTWTWIALLLFVALTIQVVTGLMRVSYRNISVSPEAVEAKGRAALIKHGVFVALFLFAAVMAFAALQP